MTDAYVSFLLVIMSMLILLVGLAGVLYKDPYIQKDNKRIIYIIIVLVISLIAQNYIESLLMTGTPRRTMRTVVSIYGYSVRPVLITLFSYIIQKKGNKRLQWILSGINGAVYLSALFCGAAFYISESNHFQRGPLGYTCHIITGLLLLNLLLLTAFEFGTVRSNGSWVPVFNTMLIILAVALDMTVLSDYVIPVTALTLAVVCSCILYYMWLHLQFVREHEEDLMAQQRIQIMMSQIQPHFLYNTISTIRVLCASDPDKAAKVAENFGVYLRQNLASIGVTETIPFGKELEHTRVYAEIEKVRFDTVQVEYDIQDMNFKVPPLTLQPIVENAIRHGIRIREEGIVRVSTRRTQDGHEITVWDNGDGFDAKKVEEADSTHVGIRNVRERIEKMCHGTFVIDSSPGSETKVTIRIPDEV